MENILNFLFFFIKKEGYRPTKEKKLQRYTDIPRHASSENVIKEET
jgi:hypothetical protein